jgi:hypothetical protein
VGNRRAREFQLEQERLARVAEDERAMLEPRPASLRHLIGSMPLRLQLIILPSFNEARAWEIRNARQGWTLGRPRLVASDGDPLLAGFDQVSFSSQRLQDFHRQLLALALPLGPNLDGFGGADGSLYQLAVYGDIFAHFRFQWWSVPPPQWQPMVNILSEMIRAFLMAEGRSAEECANWLE